MGSAGSDTVLSPPLVSACMFRVNKKFQRKIVNIFLPIIFSICFGCSKEPSH